MKTHTIQSTMSIALAQAAITVCEAGKQHPVVNKIVSAMERKQHEIKRNDWNANLSFKTYNILKNQGIIV